MSKLDPKVKQAMDLLQKKTVHHDSAEAAAQAASENPVVYTPEQEKFFEEIIFEQTGCKKIVFLLPEKLIERLEALDALGVDANDFVANSLEASLKMIDSVLLGQSKQTEVVPSVCSRADRKQAGSIE